MLCKQRSSEPSPHVCKAHAMQALPGIRFLSLAARSAMVTKSEPRFNRHSHATTQEGDCMKAQWGAKAIGHVEGASAGIRNKGTAHPSLIMGAGHANPSGAGKRPSQPEPGEDLPAAPGGGLPGCETRSLPGSIPPFHRASPVSRKQGRAAGNWVSHRFIRQTTGQSAHGMQLGDRPRPLRPHIIRKPRVQRPARTQRNAQILCKSSSGRQPWNA